MSMGPLGTVGSAAGTQLAQARGSETERAQQDANVQQTQKQGEKNAESASGVGETAEDQESSERDADGRRLWERPPEESSSSAQEDESSPQSRDATGDCGGNLDLSG